MATTIYCLCDPCTEEIRYIGKTVAPLHRRLSAHMSNASQLPRTHLRNWLRSSTNPPVIRALVVVEDSDASDIEIKTIASFRKQGYRLTNTTDGGEGHLGFIPSKSTRIKIGNANRGRKMPPMSDQTKERRRVAAQLRVGIKHSLETRHRLHLALLGNKNGLGNRGPVDMVPWNKGKRGSVSWMKGRNHSDETKARISASKLGIPTHTILSREAISAGLKRSYAEGRRGKKKFLLTEEKCLVAPSKDSLSLQSSLT